MTPAVPPPEGSSVLAETPGSDVAPLVPGYIVEKLIGAGSFGVVVQAVQVKLDRTVALKTVPFDRDARPAAVARFEAEAVALARVQHPNVVTVYDCGRHGDRAYIAMELLVGEDFAKRLKRAGRTDERTTWLVVRQAAAGLAHAFAAGVVHRDVKPANLFLCPPPTGFVHPAGVPMVKVTDFGLALVQAHRPPSAPARPPGLTGTPIYMAPEVFRGEPHDHRADIYALGVTAYYALSGSSPFPAADIWDVMARKGDPLPPLPAGVGSESAALVAVMTDPDPGRRVGSYDDLFARIDQLTCLKGSRLVRIPAPERPQTRLGWLVVALLAAVGAFQVALWRGFPTAPVRYVQGDYAENLFVGKGVDGWLGPGVRQEAGEDGEGNAVLVGRGRFVRGFAPLDDFRLTVGLDLSEATAVEVAVATGGEPPFVTLVSRDKGVQAGTFVGDGFTPLGPAVPYPARSEDRLPYYELRYERTGGVWRAYFENRELTVASDAGRSPRAEVRFATEGGAVRINSAVVENLLAAPEE
jgi:hypothetical protein